MPASRLIFLKNKAKLLQKAKKKAGKPIQLKTALGIVAKASGYPTWRALRSGMDAGDLLSPRGSAFWNVWYATYEDAKKHLDTSGGYLLPYQRHFFICDIHYIESLGLSPSDADLKKVGNDWVWPKDAAAWKKLKAKLI